MTTSPAPTPKTTRWITCPICQKRKLARGRRRYCSPPCKQAAYRQRQRQLTTQQPLTAPSGPRPAHTIYQCPECENRYLELQRCPDCQLFCRRLGTGGHTPCCDELVTIEELVPGIGNTPHPKQPNNGAAMP